MEEKRQPRGTSSLGFIKKAKLWRRVQRGALGDESEQAVGAATKVRTLVWGASGMWRALAGWLGSGASRAGSSPGNLS